jgi:hypothetical protein
MFQTTFTTTCDAQFCGEGKEIMTMQGHLWGYWSNMEESKVWERERHYYAHHVVAMVVVSAQSNSNILTTRNCVGLNYRSIQQTKEHM